MPETWQDIASRKQAERASRIPPDWLLPASYSAPNSRSNVQDVPRECGILTADEIRITEGHDATGLVSGLAKGTLRSVDVVTAFCKRAAIAQQLINCLTEIFFDDALARAKMLDEHLQKTGKPMGPLHGLPISLKDTFNVKNYDSSLGVAGFCFRPASKNSALVDLLLSQGAVLYCKTNVPLTMMALDSHNNVFGRTVNPANRHLTPGGSSGGEGALVGFRGSPIGIGTDVGGSIRIPAMCNGLIGVKPSHGRVPYAGQQGGALPGSSKIALETTAGPIARTVRDAEMLLRAISNADPWRLDPDVLPHRWDLQPSLQLSSRARAPIQPLRIGVARTDGHCTPLPPVQTLLDEVFHTLKTPKLDTWESIEVFEIDISSFGPALLKTFNGLVSIDGSNTWLNHLELTGEPLSPWLQTRIRRRAQKPLDEVQKLQGQKTELQTAFLDVWAEKGGYWSTPDSKAKKGTRTLDLIICPVAPHPVAPIDRWNTANYTSAFNLLDLPAGVLPIRPFRESDLALESLDSPPLNGWDKINRELWTKVDRNVYMGSTLSIQVLTPRLEERRLVEGMAVLERALAPLAGADRRANKL